MNPVGIVAAMGESEMEPLLDGMLNYVASLWRKSWKDEGEEYPTLDSHRYVPVMDVLGFGIYDRGQEKTIVRGWGEREARALASLLSHAEIKRKRKDMIREHEEAARQRARLGIRGVTAADRVVLMMAEKGV